MIERPKDLRLYRVERGDFGISGRQSLVGHTGEWEEGQVKEGSMSRARWRHDELLEVNDEDVLSAHPVIRTDTDGNGRGSAAFDGNDKVKPEVESRGPE